MKMKAKGALGMALGLVGTCFLVPTPARAGDCSASCDNDIGCYGDCEIDIDDCGTICYDTGCSVTCKAVGPKDCEAGTTQQCMHVNPPPFAFSGGHLVERTGADWAVVRFHEADQLDAADVMVVRASSDDFAQSSRAEVAKRENEATATLQKDPDAAPVLAKLGTDREMLFVAPHRQCVNVHASLATRTWPGDRPTQSQIVYFRATTDSTGRIVTFDVLHSEAPEALTSRLVTFGRDNLRISARKNPRVPLEAFGFLRLNVNGKLGYSIEGGSPLF